MEPSSPIYAYRPSQSLTDTLLKVALVGAGLYFLNKTIQNYKKTSTESETGTNPVVQQAQALRVAMNPSGLEWLRRVDGTSVDEINTIASQIKSIKDVGDAYNRLFQSSLYEDLQTELSAADYQKFLNIFRYNPTSESNTIQSGSMVVTKLDTNVRKTPVNLSKYWFNSNIIKLVPKGKFIGFTTGKKSFDSASNTAYIELKTFNGANLFWVAPSQVDQYSPAEFETRYGKKYSQMIEAFKDVSFSGFLPRKLVILSERAPIYNQYGEVVSRPDGRLILGDYLMEILKKDQTTLVQFKNIEGKLRLVNKQYVKIINT